MDTLRVDICYRPLRLAWVIRRGDFESLRRIFRVSHTLWGGRSNPVIVSTNLPLLALQSPKNRDFVGVPDGI